MPLCVRGASTCSCTSDPRGPLSRAVQFSSVAALSATPIVVASLPDRHCAMTAADARPAPPSRPPIARRGAARRRRNRGVSVVLRLRGKPRRGRLGRRAAPAGCPGGAALASFVARRISQPAVLPVDVLWERDARHSGNVGGRVPRLRAGNDKLLVLLPPDVPPGGSSSSNSLATALRQVGRWTWSRPRALSPSPAPLALCAVGHVRHPALRVHPMSASSPKSEPRPLLPLLSLILTCRASREIPRLAPTWLGGRGKRGGRRKQHCGINPC